MTSASSPPNPRFTSSTPIELSAAARSRRTPVRRARSTATGTSGRARRYDRGDPVLHIEFRNWADLLVVAPLDANTLAKLAIGLCDNFLTCLFRAWDFSQARHPGPGHEHAHVAEPGDRDDISASSCSTTAG